MKCLGATDRFLKANFILESCCQGVVGGVLIARCCAEYMSFIVMKCAQVAPRVRGTIQVAGSFSNSDCLTECTLGLVEFTCGEVVNGQSVQRATQLKLATRFSECIG